MRKEMSSIERTRSRFHYCQRSYLFLKIQKNCICFWTLSVRPYIFPGTCIQIMFYQISVPLWPKVQVPQENERTISNSAFPKKRAWKPTTGVCIITYTVEKALLLMNNSINYIQNFLINKCDPITHIECVWYSQKYQFRYRLRISHSYL